MAVDFEVEPEFQAKLDCFKEFVKSEVEPIDLYFRWRASPYDKGNETARRCFDHYKNRCGTRNCGPASSATNSAVAATAR